MNKTAVFLDIKKTHVLVFSLTLCCFDFLRNMQQPALTNCSSCSAALPSDGISRKRQRARRCRKCNNDKALERRQNDPILRLQHKFQNNCMKHDKNTDPSLWSRETIEYVWNRWEKKCAISHERNVLHLCIVPAVREKDTQPTRNQLVVLSSHIAQSLSRQDNEKRLARFPQEARAKLLEEN
jgi:hypothetical protein